MEKEWHSKVYHNKEEFFEEPEWKGICQAVKARDKNRCVSCHKLPHLTVHHIIPRKSGGTDYPPNLITLCVDCHNEIEELDIRNKKQIEDYKYDRKYIKKDHTIITSNKPVRWQQWVYGGYKNPCLTN